MADEIIEKVVKGDICWMEMAVGRCSKGIDVWIKAVPEVEEFVKSLGNGTCDPVEAYARNWGRFNSGEPLKIYRIDKDLPEAGTYTVLEPGGLPRSPKTGNLNMSFLRIVGLSEPSGVRFYIRGPYSKVFTEQFSNDLLREGRNFVRDYIAPVNVVLRITSQLA